jgi:alpha-beta hydrolase superfamily lysophospholipase
MDRFEYSWQSADGLTLYGQGWQPESGLSAVVCLVHGLGEHSGRYAGLAADLCKAGVALMSFDLRGHGRSAGLRGHAPSLDALMDDIDMLLEHAQRRFLTVPHFLYGHSLGGLLVLNYALRRSPEVAGVIASAPPLRLAFDPPAARVFLGRIMDRFRPQFQQPTGLDTRALCHDPQVIREYVQDPLVHDRISARLYLSMLDAGEWALAHAAEFKMPLLIFHGGADRLTSTRATREFAGQVKGDCTHCEWEGFYHEPHNEPQRAEVVARVVGWIKARLPQGQ